MIKIFDKLIIFLFATSFLITAYGFYNLHLNNFHFSIYSDVNIFIILLLTIEFISRITRFNRFFITGFLILLISIVTNYFIPCLIVYSFLLSAFSIGSIIYRFLIIDKKGSNINKILIGLGILGSILSITSHFEINYSYLFLIIIFIPIVFNSGKIITYGNILIKNKIYRSNSDLYDSVISALFVLYFLLALMPEFGFDALASHLFVPAHIKSNAFWGYDFIKYNWATAPMLGDWLITYPYIFAGETGAKILNANFILLNCLVIKEIFNWLNKSQLAYKWTIILFLSSPLTFSIGTTVFIDSSWSLFLISGSFYAVKLLYKENSHIENYILAGLFLGLAVATKAITFLTLLILLACILISSKNIFKKNNIKSIIAGIFLFLIFGFKSYIFSWYFTGNPFYPFFNSFFESEYYPLVNFSADHYKHGFSILFTYLVNFDSSLYNESKINGAGFHLSLITIPAILIAFINRLYKEALLLFIAILCIWLTFEFTSYLRYIFPALTILLISVCSSLFSKNENIRFYHNIINALFFLILSLNLLFLNSGYGVQKIEAKNLINSEKMQHYESIMMPLKDAVKEVNKINIDKTPVAIFTSNAIAGLESDAIYFSWYNIKFNIEVLEIASEDELKELLESYGVEYLIIGDNFPFTVQKGYIEEMSSQCKRFGNEVIRKLDYLDGNNCDQNKKFKDRKELILNSDFENMEHWNYIEDNIYLENSIVSLVSSPVSQAVAIKDNKEYVLSVEAKCKNKIGTGRLQVNWLGIEGNYISTSLITFECSKYKKTYNMYSVAPKESAIAVVFASAHTNDVPIVFNSVSFK